MATLNIFFLVCLLLSVLCFWLWALNLAIYKISILLMSLWDDVWTALDRFQLCVCVYVCVIMLAAVLVIMLPTSTQQTNFISKICDIVFARRSIPSSYLDPFRFNSFGKQKIYHSKWGCAFGRKPRPNVHLNMIFINFYFSAQRTNSAHL